MKKRSHLRAGVIDIGSNSIKLTIGERKGDDILVLESLKNVVPFASHAFYRGRITQSTTNQTIIVLDRYKALLNEYHVSEIRIIATTAIREARNRQIFIDTIARKTGFNIEILNVGDVVYFLDSYLVHKLRNSYPVHEKNLIIIELGSGSVDVSVVEKGSLLMNAGFPVGTMRLRQLVTRSDGSAREIIEATRESVEIEISYLKRMLPDIPFDDVILIDENYSGYLASLISSLKTEHGFFSITSEQAKELLSNVSDKNSDDIASEYPIPVEIAEGISEYAIILNTLYSLLDMDRMYILETSLSEAVLANVLFGFEQSREFNTGRHLISAAEFICRKYNLDINHSRHVAKLSQVLFDKLADVLGLNRSESIYLILAAYLHDIGLFIHNRAHHKHTEYIISSFDLFRLTGEELKVIACIARYHRKGAPQERHLVYGSLPKQKQLLIQKLSALLRIANALDRSHKQKIKEIEVEFGDNENITIIGKASVEVILEKTSFIEKKDLFEEISGSEINLSIEYGS